MSDFQGFKNDGGNFSGIFVGTATIVAARSISNEDIYKNGKPVDVGIEFTVDIEKEFQPKFSISGNYKVKDGKIAGWGSTMRVKMALDRLRVKWSGLNADNSVPDDVLAQCVGKKILRLQFPYKKDPDTQKNKYVTYSEIFLADAKDGEAKLRASYAKAVAGGHVKPIQDDAVEFPGPVSAESAAPDPQV